MRQLFMILALALVMAGSTQAATYNKPLHFSSQWDSVWFFVQTGLDTVRDDSGRVTSMDVDTFVTLEGTQDHSILYLYYEGGDEYPSSEYVAKRNLSTFDETTDSVLLDYGVAAGYAADSTLVDSSTYRADVSGLSTFDETADSVLLNYGAQAGWTADSVLADADSYKADVSGLSTFDETTDSVLVNYGAQAGWSADSVLADADSYKADVSGLSTFDETTDSVLVNYGAQAGWTADSVLADADSYKATGFSTFDNTTDSVLFDYAEAGAIVGDSVWFKDTNTTVAGTFASLMDATVSSGGSSAEISDADMVAIADTVYNRAAADTGDGSLYGQWTRDIATAAAGSSFDPTTDSVIFDYGVAAGWTADSVLADAASYKADVSGLSTFDETSDSVLFNYGAAAGWAADSVLADAASYKADVSGLSTFDETTDSVLFDYAAAGQVAADSVSAQAVFINATNTTGSFASGDFGSGIFQWSHFNADFGAGVADDIWDELLNTGHGTANSAGDIIYGWVDSIDAKVSTAGATASISDADMGAIGDTLMRRAEADTVTGSWTAAVTRKADSAASGATATIADADMTAIADTVFDRVVADTGNGSMFGLWTQYLANASTFDASSDSVIPDHSSMEAVIDSIAVAVKDTILDSIPPLVWGSDSTEIDSSEVGAWIAAAASGSATVSTADKEEIAGLVADTAAANPSYFYGPTASGSGIRSILVLAIDTSGTDDTIPGVRISVQNASGITLAGPKTTNNSGSASFSLDDGVTTFLGNMGASYTFADSTITISGNDTVAVLGYNNVIASPSDSTVKATLYGYLYGPTGDADTNTVVRCWRLGDNATISSIGVTVTPYTMWDTTDATGYWSFDVYRTGSFDDTTKGFYHIDGFKNRQKAFQFDSLYIPSTGNVDLTDSLANR